MKLIYDGLHQLHLSFLNPDQPQEWLFDNADTDELAMFLYPRACAIVANKTMKQHDAAAKGK